MPASPWIRPRPRIVAASASRGELIVAVASDRGNTVTVSSSNFCREVLNQTLLLVQEIMKGVAMYLPMFTGPQVEGW